MKLSEMRERCASRLLAAEMQVSQMNAFIGLDGFVDEILHVVDKRESVDQYQRLRTMKQFAERLAAAAGRSTNIELVRQIFKLGGNGPILANALASFGVNVTYLGLLGYPSLHPVFAEFSRRAQVYSIGEPGHTDALEFEDGKIMLGKTQPLGELNWGGIRERFGEQKFLDQINKSHLVGCVNWTMLTRMNDIWAAMIREICPALTGSRRKLFVDLCDPEKRTRDDILTMLKRLENFENYFEVILGLNEKETYEIGNILGLNIADHSPEGLSSLGLKIQQRISVSTVVIHPTTYALAVGKGGINLVEGPYTPTPRITTGAGDHFNSGFCLGKLLGFDDTFSLMAGVSTSGHYVRTATSPTLADLAHILRHWPTVNP